MGFFSKVFKVIKKAAPIAAMFIPGLGPIASAALGAGLGAAGGGGLKGALLGGAGGYVGAGGMLGGTSSLGSQLSNAAGFAGAGAKTLTSGIGGALSGAANGGSQGALLGGLTGGIMANGDDIANWANNGLSEAGNTARGALGMNPTSEYLLNAPATMSDATKNSLLGAGYSPLQIQGMVSGGSMSTQGAPASSDAKSTANNAGGGSSMFTSSKLSDVLSGLSNVNTTNKNEEELLKAQRQAQGYMNPYYTAGTGALTKLQSRLDTGFQPGDLTQDPGYQFQLEQGNKNLSRSLGAQGGLFSGRALQAAQDYGQGLAEQTYQQAYNRWLQENNQLSGLAGTGYNSGTQLGDMATTYGQTKAEANANRSNTLTGLSSMLLGGRIIGWDRNGNAIYENSGKEDEVITPAGV